MDVASKNSSEQFDRAGEAPETCNTGASFRLSDPVASVDASVCAQADTKCPGQNFGDIKGGFDWLDASLYGSWDVAAFDSLVKELDELRARAENGADAVYVSPEGDELGVCPHGKPGVSARWVLRGDGMEFSIVNRAEENDGHCSVFVHIGSVKLMLDGIHKAWEDARGVLRAMGFRYSRSLASRADMCVDLPGVDCREFVQMLMCDRAITKAIKGAMYWKGVPGVESSTGFDVGTETRLRVYDKLCEVEHDATKAAIMVERRWGGCVPECATRVEFQMKRASLKDNWAVEGVEDLIVKAPSICEWLTHRWFRLSEEFDRKNRNHDTAVTAPLWLNVQAAFRQVFEGLELVKPSLRKYVPDPTQLVKQVVGCGASILACGNAWVNDAEHYAETLAEMVRKEAVGGYFKFLARCKEFARRAELPYGNRTGAFDDWNAAGEGTVGGNVKKEKELAYARERAERQAARDAKHSLLLDIGQSFAEASF